MKKIREKNPYLGTLGAIDGFFEKEKWIES